MTGTFDNWTKSERLDRVGDVFLKTVTLPQSSDKIFYKVGELPRCLPFVRGSLDTRLGCLEGWGRPILQGDNKHDVQPPTKRAQKRAESGGELR